MTDRRAPASEDLMHDLHSLTAEAFLAEIRRYRNGEVLDRDGSPLPVPAALLTSASKFLKDNGVDRPIKPGDAADLLADEMPDLPDNVSAFRPR